MAGRFVLPGILAALAVACFAYSCGDYREASGRPQLCSTGERTEAKVVDASSWREGRRRYSSGSLRYSIAYAFNAGGRTVEATGRRVGGLLQRGRTMPVWYDPSNPQRCVSQAELDYGPGMSRMAGFVLTVGIVLVIGAVKLFHG